LAGRGPGECGAGVMDVIRLDIDEAKDSLRKTPVESENVYKAIVASARALLVTAGLEPKKDREIFAAFTEHLIRPGWVRSQTQQLLDEATDWRMGDTESLEYLVTQVRELAERVEELFLSMDANLKFKVEPFEGDISAGQEGEKTHKADLRGVACPLNFVKAKLELEKIQIGDVLEVLLDEGESVRNVPASFGGQGQQVLEVKDLGSHFCLKVRRRK
jgi:sulfite reductase (ferredoxin)